MPEKDPSTDRGNGEEQPRASRIGLLAFALSIVLMIAGVGLGVMASGDAGSGGGSGTGASSQLTTEFGPGGGPQASGDTADAEDESWSPVIFRLGFSFFIGYVIAFAMRAFLRFTLLAIGVAAMLLMGLEYGGFIEVHWTLLGDRFDGFTGWLSAQTTSFTAFLRGALPSAASAGAGLLLGFRRG